LIRALLIAAGVLGLAGPAAAGCADSPDPCVVPNGTYHLALPAAVAAPPPIVVFLHGAGSSGANMIRNATLVDAIRARGYAVLAPDGDRQFGTGNGRSWTFYPGWEGRDETTFLKDVVADAAARFGADPDRVLLAGFSAGGFMVSYLACAAPETFLAYAPVSGGFWRPMPESCAGPVKLFQTHGWRDSTVPLEGRFLGGGRFQQGDIFAGLEIWRHANACPDENPGIYSETGIFWRRAWTGCAPETALEFALFPGGHTVPDGWPDMVLDWFEAVAPQ
jgi:polyhydroxybutyrate depolymerase